MPYLILIITIYLYKYLNTFIIPALKSLFTNFNICVDTDIAQSMAKNPWWILMQVSLPPSLYNSLWYTATNYNCFASLEFCFLPPCSVQWHCYFLPGHHLCTVFEKLPKAGTIMENHLIYFLHFKDQCPMLPLGHCWKTVISFCWLSSRVPKTTPRFGV